jgi:hypothetical protein
VLSFSVVRGSKLKELTRFVNNEGVVVAVVGVTPAAASASSSRSSTVIGCR